MSAAQPVSSKVFHDAQTYNDKNANTSVNDSVQNAAFEELPSGFSEINPHTVTPGDDGSLSSADSQDGETVYFGGFVSDEGKFAATNEKGQVLFFFSKSQEDSLLNALKAAQLIPESVTSFSSLGNRAIGVIENAVDQGVLAVTESGKLEVANVPEDESGSDAPTVGANRVSDTDEKGNITGEERNNDTEASKADGSGTTTAGNGSSKSGGAGADDTATATTGDATESGDGQAAGTQASSGTGTNATAGAGQGSGSSSSNTATNPAKEGGQGGRGQASSRTDSSVVTGGGQYRSNSASAPATNGTESADGSSQTTAPTGQSSSGSEAPTTYGGSTIEERDGKFYMKTASGQELEINEGAQWASGAPKTYGIGAAELNQMASEGRLVELRTPEGSIAVGLSKKQLELVEGATGKKGQAAIQEAYNGGMLGINQSTGAVAVKNTDGSTNLERRWGPQSAEDAGDVTFKQEDRESDLVNGERTNVGSESSAYSATAHYTVTRPNAEGGIMVSVNRSSQLVEVNQASLDALGFTQNTPLSEVAKAFGNGTLGVVNNEVRVLKHDVKGVNINKQPHPPMTVAGDENSGFSVVNPEGKKIPIPNEVIGQLKLPNGINAVTVANAIGSNQLQFIDGQWKTSESAQQTSQQLPPGYIPTNRSNTYVTRDNNGMYSTVDASGGQQMLISDNAKATLGINLATDPQEVVDMINDGRLVPDVVTGQWQVGNPA